MAVGKVLGKKVNFKNIKDSTKTIEQLHNHSFLQEQYR